MSRQVKYQIYPSILDKFYRFLTLKPEDYFYEDETGWHKNYSEKEDTLVFSPSEVYERTKKELIDAINRVPFTSEAASKGTAFNILIDSFITKTRPEGVPMKGDRENDVINIEVEGCVFPFSFKFIEENARRYEGAVPQVYTEATLETEYGTVLLYGYIDEVLKNKVIDLKTTKAYQFGNYEHYTQRHLYPYTLIESGMVERVDEFAFDVYPLKVENDHIRGKMYRETYNYDHEQSRAYLKSLCERFIEFLEENKESITDKKIFAA
jgi:hypothetical protein